jgi:biopolymer transport protein ExbD
MSSPTLPAISREYAVEVPTTEELEQEVKKERQLRYALLADQQTVLRAKERQIRQLETRLKSIRSTRWWRLRRWLVTTVSAVWWIEDHVD